MKVFTLLLLLVSMLCLEPLSAEEKKAKPRKEKVRQEFVKIEDDPNLPRVLIIGDSISIGYTLPTRKLLEGKANVHRVLSNCGPTIRGLDNIDKWLGETEWDVIHFNWGLHDLKYMGPKGENLADPTSPDNNPQVPIDEYRKNLKTLVKKLKETDAVLVWCATTPVPDKAQGRIIGDEVRYNQEAEKIMKEEGIMVNDLYSYALPELEKIQRPANVHFTTEGSEYLAEKVAKSIKKALRKKKKAEE